MQKLKNFGRRPKFTVFFLFEQIPTHPVIIRRQKEKEIGPRYGANRETKS